MIPPVPKAIRTRPSTDKALEGKNKTFFFFHCTSKREILISLETYLLYGLTVEWYTLTGIKKSLHMNSAVPYIRNGTHRLDHMTNYIDYRQIDDGSVNRIKNAIFNINFPHYSSIEY